MTAWAAGFHDCMSGHARGEAGSFEGPEAEAEAERETVTPMTIEDRKARALALAREARKARPTDPDQVGDPADKWDGLGETLAQLGARESGQPWGHDLLARIGQAQADKAAEADAERRERIGTETLSWSDPETGEARTVTDLPGAISGPGTAAMLKFARPLPDTRPMHDRRGEVLEALAVSDPLAALALARMDRPERKARGDMSGRAMTLPRTWQITPDPITRVRLTSDRPMAPQGTSTPCVVVRLDKGQGRFRGASVVKLLSGSARTSQTAKDGVRDRKVYMGQGAWLVWTPEHWADAHKAGKRYGPTAERPADAKYVTEALTVVEGPTPAEVTEHKRGKTADKARKALLKEAGKRDDKAHALTVRADLYAAEARAKGVRVRADKADKADTPTVAKSAKAGPAKNRKALTDSDRAELGEALARQGVSAERIAEIMA